MEPRGCRFQERSFTVGDLVGRRIEELWVSPATPAHAEMVFLKLAGLPWQRFYLEAGLGFWDEYSEVATFEDYAGMTRTDVGQRFDIVGKRVERAECLADRPHHASRVVLELEAGRVELRLVAPTDFESDAELVYIPNPVQRRPTDRWTP